MDDLADDLVHLHQAVLDNVAGMEFVVVDTENVLCEFVIFLFCCCGTFISNYSKPIN